MITRCIHILVIAGLSLFVSLSGYEVACAQTQSAGSSQDTTSQMDRPTVTREKIEYKSGGRKDPFYPLFEEKDEAEELPLLQVEEATLVGVMGSPKGKLALVRDAEGRTYVLRKEARVKNGYLRQVKSDIAIFNVAKYGRYRRVELELKSEKRARSFEKGVWEITPKPKPVIPKPPVRQLQEKPVSTIPHDETFTLQIAAFRSEKDAQRLQEWLRGRGYTTRVEGVTIPESGLWYRVRYGMYETYDSVKEMAETFRQRFDFYCWIVPIDS